MYRIGILPSGKPMMVAMPGGVSLPGTTFACASCHTRSGLGTEEGGLRTLPINGPNLFQPLYRSFPSLSPAERAEILPLRFQPPPLRPAYADGTLSRAIRKGIDPNGRPFNPIMPEYPHSDRTMPLYIHFLKRIYSRPSPGVTETRLDLATVARATVDRQA